MEKKTLSVSQFIEMKRQCISTLLQFPFTSDGRLSAKEVLGGRKEMSQRQDRYAEQMKIFGLERGEKATGIKHENAREYYARMKQAQNSIDKNDFKAQKNVFEGVYKSEKC